jgi:hypothetical protein
MDFSQAEIERFLKSFEKSESCWNWVKGMAKNGYGFFYMKREGRKTFHAHRVSWEYHNNMPIPEGMLICHTCDNKKCVNPAHLYVGTSFDNNRDTVNRNRAKRTIGDNCSWAKISEADVMDIIKSNDNQYDIAKKYGVDQSTISNIKTGKRRSNISGINKLDVKIV